MTDEKNHDILDEIKTFGINVRELLKTTWEKDENKKLKQDIAEGFQSLGKTLNDAVDEFSTSDVGSTIRKEAEDLRDRVRSGEVEQKARKEIYNALQIINRELKKVVENISTDTPKSEEEQTED